MDHLAHPALSQFPYAFDYTDRLTKESYERKSWGGFADVYQYRNPRNGLLYAVKEIVNVPRSLTLPEVAKKEYDVWHRLRHPNILQLEGIYLPPRALIPCFVTRWQENGRVKNYVQDKPDTDFLGLIEDVAEGVTYLHDNDIIHGDLRAANILISDDGRALVTDFGISKHDPGDGITLSQARQGNCRWMAREFFMTGTARRSKASDIWMFGIVMLEILSGRSPYYDISNERLIESMIGNGELSKFPNAQHTSWEKFDNPVRQLRLRYCASEPRDRPTITSVLEDIRKVLSDVAVSNLYLQTSRTLRNRFPNISSSENVSGISSGSSAVLAEENVSASARSESASETDESTIRLSEGFSYLNLSTNSRNSSADNSRTSASPTRGSVTMVSNAALNGSDANSTGHLHERNTNPGTSHGSSEQSTPNYVAIDLDNELHNYIARKGLTSRFTETQYPTAFVLASACLTRIFLLSAVDGEVIATAEARQVKQAKKEAARIALARLCNEIKPSPVSTPSQPSPSETDTYRKEGPPHNLTWIYTFYS
ncbi:hypothetical protein ACEPAG_2843 [Sanghuangporus baumii]